MANRVALGGLIPPVIPEPFFGWRVRFFVRPHLWNLTDRSETWEYLCVRAVYLSETFPGLLASVEDASAPGLAVGFTLARPPGAPAHAPLLERVAAAASRLPYPTD